MMMYSRRRRSYGFMFMIWGRAGQCHHGWASSPPARLPSCPAPQPQHLPTCWKESSKSVCRDTLIFTWLGSAFDCKPGKSRGLCEAGTALLTHTAHRAQGTHSPLLTWQRKRNWWYFQRKLRSYAPGEPPCLLLPKQQGLSHTPCPQQPPSPARRDEVPGVQLSSVRAHTSPQTQTWGSPRLEAGARVLEGGGAGVVVHEVAHALIGVLHLPARRQRRLLDHPAGKEGLTTQSPPQPQLCARQRKDSWRGTGEQLSAPQERSPAWAALWPWPCQSFTVPLCDTWPQGSPRTAPSQTLLPQWPPTPECEGLPTAWSGCCGSRNTLAHCPVSSLGEKGEEALAGVLGTALPFPAHRKSASSPIPPHQEKAG